MRHSEEERDLGSLGGKCSESIQLLGGEQSQLRLGWLGQGGNGDQDRRHWHICTWSMAGLGLPSQKGPSRAYRAQRRRSSKREQLLQVLVLLQEGSEVALELLHGQHSWQK